MKGKKIRKWCSSTGELWPPTSRREPKISIWADFGHHGAMISHPTGQLPKNCRIFSTSYINATELNGANLVSRPFCEESSLKLVPKVNELISGPAAWSFSPSSTNCLRATAQISTHEPKPTIDRMKSWSQALKHETHRKYRIFRFPTIFSVCNNRVLDTYNELSSNHCINLHLCTE